MAPRLAFAYACAVLIGYVGLVHEVVGATLIPVVPIATVTGAAGGVALVGEALRHGGFHFFAFTLLLAGALVAATWWRSDIPSDAT